MDSHSVNKLIRTQVWPMLRSEGFRAFSARSAWRYAADSIDVVNLQSFNSYHAGGLESTTFSFAINLGKCLGYIPPHFAPCKVKVVGGLPRPAEFQCQLRRHLRKHLVQVVYPRRDVWFVEPDGGNLPAVISDAGRTIGEALPWFQQYDAATEVLRTLREDAEDMAATWGIGRNPSPIRYFYRGFAALHLGQFREAANDLASALASGAFESVAGTIGKALQRCSGASC